MKNYIEPRTVEKICASIINLQVLIKNLQQCTTETEHYTKMRNELIASWKLRLEAQRELLKKMDKKGHPANIPPPAPGYSYRLF
jgi:hypothetical protein